MKLYALKHKDEYIEFAVNEWQLLDNYKFETHNPDLKNYLKVVKGEFKEVE